MLHRGGHLANPAAAGGSQIDLNKYTFPNGVVLTRVLSERNEVAELLEIQMWKFDLNVPNGSPDLQCDLEVREKGKPAQVIETYQIPQSRMKDHTNELSCAIFPLDGDLFRSEKIKWRIGFPGDASSTTMLNPFKNAVSYGGAPYIIDGGLALLEVNLPKQPDLGRGKSTDVRSVQLVLNIRAVTYE